jgi:hypothetical integral membrane protein (TIGR02206 family)
LLPDTFRSFGALHAGTLGAIALLIAVAILVAWRRAPSLRPTAMERAMGWAYLAAWATTFAFLAFPPLLDPPKTYPLQLCHWTGLAAGLYLIARWRWLRPIVYFWGLALCTQALITPTLIEGPAIWPFWFFWATHGLIVGVAAYDVIVLGYRPGLRDYGIACAAAAAYVAMILPVNLAFGWNYGFVGPSKPDVPTLVDLLGPWPERLAIIVPLVAGVMFLLLLPWMLARRLGAGLESKA